MPVQFEKYNKHNELPLQQKELVQMKIEDWNKEIKMKMKKKKKKKKGCQSWETSKTAARLQMYLTFRNFFRKLSLKCNLLTYMPSLTFLFKQNILGTVSI